MLRREGGCIAMAESSSTNDPKPAPVPDRRERRTWIRYPSRSVGSLQLLESETELGWWALIQDVSQGGMALVLPRRVAPGTVLLIDEPPVRAEKQGRALPICVVHAAPHPGGRWIIGCQFSEPISEQALLALTQPGELREPTRPTRVITRAVPGHPEV
jgi:PilZ domain